MTDFFNRPPKNNLEKSPVIEIATEKDWEAFKKIRLDAIAKDPEAFGSSPERLLKESNRSEEEWKDILKKDSQFILLAKNGLEPIGLEVTRKGKEENEWHTLSVYIKEEFRGLGIGKEIFEKTLEEIRKRGGKKVTLNVNRNEAQEAARNMYEKHGFKIINTDAYNFYDMELNLD